MRTRSLAFTRRFWLEFGSVAKESRYRWSPESTLGVVSTRDSKVEVWCISLGVGFKLLDSLYRPKRQHDKGQTEEDSYTNDHYPGGGDLGVCQSSALTAI